VKLRPWQRNILSAVIIAAGGFLLWLVAFIVAAGFMYLFRMAFADVKADSSMFWKYVYFAFILLVSTVILRSKRINRSVKATYLTMPLMVALVLAGIQFYQYSKLIPISIGAAIVGIVFLFLAMKKLPWQYYFATAYTGLTALFVILTGIEI
jgi:hypothetical protein